MIVVPNEDRRRHPVGYPRGVSLFPKAIGHEPHGSGCVHGIHGWTPLLGASKRVGTCVRNSSRGCTPCGPVPDKTGSYPVPCRGPVGIGQHGQVGTCFFFFFFLTHALHTTPRRRRAMPCGNRQTRRFPTSDSHFCLKTSRNYEIIDTGIGRFKTDIDVRKSNVNRRKEKPI